MTDKDLTEPEAVERLVERMRTAYGGQLYRDCTATLRALSAKLEAAEAELAALKVELAEVVGELADDLSVEVEARYPIADRNYPTIHNRYNRDIGPVIRARALLARHQKETGA